MCDLYVLSSSTLQYPIQSLACHAVLCYTSHGCLSLMHAFALCPALDVMQSRYISYIHQVPVGVPGRMWIAGPTLAIGYLNMPERTAERFVPDPFAKAKGREGERMYDTGDRCRYLPSGSIEVIGRCDFMVKVLYSMYLLFVLLSEYICFHVLFVLQTFGCCLSIDQCMH